MNNPIKVEKIGQTCGQLKTADFVKNIQKSSRKQVKIACFRLLYGRSAELTSQQVARNTSQSQMCELSREPPKLILRFGEPLCDFAATRYAPVHKFHLANRTSLQARALGVSLIARRTPFSQSEKRRANTAHRPKRRKNEGSNIPSFFLWSKCGGSNSGPHGPEPCALPAALHLENALLF